MFFMACYMLSERFQTFESRLARNLTEILDILGKAFAGVYIFVLTWCCLSCIIVFFRVICPFFKAQKIHTQCILNMLRAGANKQTNKQKTAIYSHLAWKQGKVYCAPLVTNISPQKLFENNNLWFTWIILHILSSIVSQCPLWMPAAYHIHAYPRGMRLIRS